MRKLQSGVTRLTYNRSNQITRAWRVISTISSPKRQHADEIDSAGDNLGVESDSQANQLNQTKVLPGTTTLKRKAVSSEQTIVLCLCACLGTE